MLTIQDCSKIVANEMGFDVNSDVYKIHFSNYSYRIAEVYAEQFKDEIKKLKEEKEFLLKKISKRLDKAGF